MSSIAERYGTVILFTLLVGVPLATLAAALLIRARRRAGWSRSWAWRASVSEVGMLMGTAPWLWRTRREPDDEKKHFAQVVDSP